VIDADDFPLIGEPLPVEFANSLYASEGGDIDFLATPAHIQKWFELAAAEVPFPTRLSGAEANALRELRDAIRAVLRAVAAGTVPGSDNVAMLNRYAARAPWSVHLGWNHAGSPVATERRHGTTVDTVLGRLAGEAIVVVAGPSGPLIRQCTGPGCAMLFVKDHHKRRWCHHSCGHRARQANYYRRKKAVAGHHT